MTGQVLFWSWFNTLPFGPARQTETWTEQRFRFWQAFTLNSILGQQEGDWRYWLVCSRELRHLTDPLRDAITDPRVEMVFDDECCGLLARLPAADRYLLSRVDSDDLYHPKTASTLLKQQPTAPFLQFNQGFAVDVRKGDLLPWRSRSSPFYTHVYGEEIRALKSWSEPNHTKVAPQAQVLGSGHFLVSIHGANTSTTRAHAAGGAFPTERSLAIARQFGIAGTRPIDELTATARAPVTFEPRWRELLHELAPIVAEVNGTVREPPLPLTAVAVLKLACELSAARLVLVVDDVAAAVVLRASHSGPCALSVSDPGLAAAVVGRLPPALAAYAEDMASSPTSLSFDVVYVDLTRSGLAGVLSATRAAAPTGLVVVAGITCAGDRDALGRALGGLLVDRYPQVESLAREDSGGTCWLLGRPLIS